MFTRRERLECADIGVVLQTPSFANDSLSSIDCHAADDTLLFPFVQDFIAIESI